MFRKENSKIACITLSIMLAFSTCTQEALETIPTDQSKKSILELANKKYYVNKENALVFSTPIAYYELTDSLLRLTDKDFLEWEKKINFKSYRTVVQEILDTATEYEDETKFVSQYSNYVQLDDNGFIEPIIQAQSYSVVLNKDRVFYIGDKKHIINESCVSVTGADNYKCEFKYNNMITKSNEYGNTLEYPAISSEPANKRKVFTWFKIYRNIVTAPNGSVFHAIDLDITVRPRKLVSYVFGSSWKDYNTICHIDELKIHMPGIGGNTFFDENGQVVYKEDEYWSLKTSTSSNECSRFTCTYRLKTSASEITGALQDIVCIHYRARTRGTGRNGAAYNIFHPLPGMSNCGHRDVTPYQYTQY